MRNILPAALGAASGFIIGVALTTWIQIGQRRALRPPAAGGGTPMPLPPGTPATRAGSQSALKNERMDANARQASQRRT